MPSGLWKDILSTLESSFSRPNFVTWLKPSKLIEEGEGLLSIAVPNEYGKIWIEKNALKEIRAQLDKHYPTINNLRVLVLQAEAPPTTDLPLLQTQLDSPEETDEIHESRESYRQPAKKIFNNSYTFDTFIVGNNNRLAFAAAQAVAERPGEAYNPLFIYGGVGLGKTHLMQAIGNEIVQKSPTKKIAFISCETFTSEFIQALQNKTIDQFKNKYRSIDVLLVDDIQFLSNKEGTQEEFFHTFNVLHQSNRQIIMTSDRVPKEIPNLEERLSSRFGWGMIADIQTPNFETRMAILQEKTKERGQTIPGDVLEFIASTVTSNVRELEGSLTKLFTASKIENEPITISFTERILKDLTKQTGTVSAKKVIQTVANYFHIEITDLLGKKRIKELVYPRQITMYLLRERLKHSYPQIGEEMGGKDHTTVMHSVEKITSQKRVNATIEKDISSITQELYG